MSIDPKLQSFIQLLESRLFRVPRYQRAYSWTKKQRDDFFSDIEVLYDQGAEFHFMATVVGVKRGCKQLGTSEFNEIDIVDGQQRITTLVLLMRAIVDSLPEGDDDKNDLLKRLVKDDNHTLLLLQTNHDYNQYYADYIRYGSVPRKTNETTIADRNLINAIYDVRGYVEKWREREEYGVHKLLALIKNRLHFIYHELQDEKLAYTVFEVLNTRGLEVAWLDRCKAMLMGVAFEKAENSHEMIDELHNVWADIYKTIGLRQGMSSEALRFSATLWMTDWHTSRVLSSEDSFQAFREVASKDASQTIAISREILETSRILDKLFSDQLKSAVTKIGHARLLAVAIIRAFAGEHQTNLLRQWENVTFRIYGLCSRDARTRVGHYVRLAQRVYKSNNTNDNYGEFMADIKNLAGSEFSPERAAEELREADCFEGWEDELRYLFFSRERWLSANRGGKISKFQWNKIWSTKAVASIEHVYPQSGGNSRSWEMLRNEDDGETVLKNRIGNLLLLPPDVNSSVGAKDFDYKKEVYRQSGLLVAKEVSDYARWDKESIECRENNLIEWASEYWGDLC